MGRLYIYDQRPNRSYSIGGFFHPPLLCAMNPKPLPRHSLRLEACKKWELALLKAQLEGQAIVNPADYGCSQSTAYIRISDARLGFQRYPEYKFAGNSDLLANLKVEEMADGTVRIRDKRGQTKLAELRKKANEMVDRIFDKNTTEEERTKLMEEKDKLDEEIIKQMNGGV